MNNGLYKGGEPDVLKVIHSAPGLEDLWQLHFSQLSGQEYTVPGMFIANTADEPQRFVRVSPADKRIRSSAGTTHNGTAYWLQVFAQPHGTFTITNTRNGFSKTYSSRDEVE
jgi:competence protein ComEC